MLIIQILTYGCIFSTFHLSTGLDEQSKPPPNGAEGKAVGKAEGKASDSASCVAKFTLFGWLFRFILRPSASSRLQDDRALTTFQRRMKTNQSPKIYVRVYLLDPKNTRNKQSWKVSKGGYNSHFFRWGFLGGRHGWQCPLQWQQRLRQCNNANLLFLPPSALLFLFVGRAAGPQQKSQYYWRFKSSSHTVRVINYRIPGVLLKNMCVSLPDDPPRPLPPLFVWALNDAPRTRRLLRRWPKNRLPCQNCS